MVGTSGSHVRWGHETLASNGPTLRADSPDSALQAGPSVESSAAPSARRGPRTFIAPELSKSGRARASRRSRRSSGNHAPPPRVHRRSRAPCRLLPGRNATSVVADGIVAEAAVIRSPTVAPRLREGSRARRHRLRVGPRPASATTARRAAPRVVRARGASRCSNTWARTAPRRPTSAA